MRRSQVSNEPVQDDSPENGIGGASREPSSGPQRVKARRAVQACSNCRKHKLRCLGGWPCNRCEKQKISCDFDRPGHPAAAKATETIERLEQLEASVTSILASMSSSISSTLPSQHGVVSDVEPFRQSTPIQASSFHTSAGGVPQSGYSFQVDALQPSLPGPSGSTFTSTSPRQYTLPIDTQLPTSPEQPSPAVRTDPDSEFLSAPTQDLDPPATQNLTTQVSPPIPTSPTSQTASPSASSFGSRLTRLSRTEPPPSIESRLQAAADPFSAPFKGVLHQPNVWNNSEQDHSRRASLEPQLLDEDMHEDKIQVTNGTNDPIGAGIVTREVAMWLFDFFAVRCHPFMPVVDFSQHDAYDAIQHKSSFLFSSILAIAARFVICTPADPLFRTNPVPDSARLASLAEFHLSQTLLCKKHTLSDVQATLLLAGWGLQPGGAGPDAWLLTGHAWRMARRLGLWHAHRQDEGPSHERQAGYMQRWRTWMCLFAFDRCLELGFGRPASQFDDKSVDADGFVQECVARTTLPVTVSAASSANVSMSTGDFFIASQVQLMLIGRDLCTWLEAVRDRDRNGVPSWNWEMVEEMNARLDKWSRDWTWPSSPYLPYMNSSTRTARMYSEHVRLCLNSLALRTNAASVLKDSDVERYLEKALNSATTIIQMHHDAATTDGGLSFCVDYLTIVLATAAVFLIRLVRAQTRLLDSGVVVHYLKMAASALEKSEQSHTGLSTHLAKTIREMAHAAGLGDAFPHGENSPRKEEAQDAHTGEFDQVPLDSTLEALMIFQNQVDPSYLGFLFGDSGVLG